MVNLMHIGTALVLIGMLVLVIGAFRNARSAESEIKAGVGGFIGPIPFGFANDRTVMYFIIGLMAVTIAVWFVLIKFYS